VLSRFERRGVQKRGMSQIHEIVHDKKVASIDLHMAVDFGIPSGIAKRGKLWHLRSIGRRWVSHPNPYQIGTFYGREVLNVQCARNCAVAIGILDATTRAIEPKAMINALDVIADQFSEAQRNNAMRTAIPQCGNRTIRLSVQHDSFIKKSTREQFVLNFIAPRRSVPSVPDETHFYLLKTALPNEINQSFR
jgi:hypothetical protein